MPLYDYRCPEHGHFQALAPMNEHDQPSHCPHCNALSARVIVIPPHIAAQIKQQEKAMERAAAAKEGPMTLDQFEQQEAEQQDQIAHQHKHDKGCGCNPQRKSNLMYTAAGDKMFPSMRPWMISH